MHESGDGQYGRDGQYGQYGRDGLKWPLDHPFTERLRALSRLPNANYDTYRKGIENQNPEISANVIIGLIKVTTYLLFKQLSKLEQELERSSNRRDLLSRRDANFAFKSVRE